MKVYRVSEIVKGKVSYRNQKMLDAAEGGNRIHAALAEKHKGLGRHIEKQQVLFLIRDYSNYPIQPKFTSIEDLILGTPDIYKTEGDTLYVTD